MIQFIEVSFFFYARNRIMDSVKNRIKNCVMKRKYHDNQEPQKEKECNKIRYDKENFESKKVY